MIPNSSDLIVVSGQCIHGDTLSAHSTRPEFETASLLVAFFFHQSEIPQHGLIYSLYELHSHILGYDKRNLRKSDLWRRSLLNLKAKHSVIISDKFFQRKNTHELFKSEAVNISIDIDQQ